MEIGKEIDTVTIEPVEDPVKGPAPVEKEREEVPA